MPTIKEMRAQDYDPPTIHPDDMIVWMKNLMPGDTVAVRIYNFPQVRAMRGTVLSTTPAQVTVEIPAMYQKGPFKFWRRELKHHNPGSYLRYDTSSVKNTPYGASLRPFDQYTQGWLEEEANRQEAMAIRQQAAEQARAALDMRLEQEGRALLDEMMIDSTLYRAIQNMGFTGIRDLLNTLWPYLDLPEDDEDFSRFGIIFRVVNRTERNDLNGRRNRASS